MAVPVIQVTPVDPSIGALPNAAGFQEYIVFGTNYVLDTIAQIVYTFVPLSGVLNITNASYTAFQSFLALNPVTSTQPPPSLTTPSAASQTGLGSLFTPVPAASPNFAATQLSITQGEAQIIAILNRLLQVQQGALLANISLATQGGLANENDFAPAPTTGTFQ